MSANLDALSVAGAVYLADTNQIPMSDLVTIADAIEEKWGETQSSGKADEIIQEFVQYLKTPNPLVEYSKERGLKDPMTIDQLIMSHRNLIAELNNGQRKEWKDALEVATQNGIPTNIGFNLD